VEEDETGGECGTYGGEEKCHRVLVGKCEGNRPLEYTYRRSWEDDIKMELKEEDRMVWTAFIWFSTGINGRLLRRR
jgi:hypothetical protein